MTTLASIAADSPAPSAMDRRLPWLQTAVPNGYYEDEDLRTLASRATAYLEAGVPVHFRGPAGMGKTTLALEVAARIGRPVTFITGDRWVTRADLVGREVGQSISRVDDQYVASVRRTETRTRNDWKDAPLSLAMSEGHTLVYDEFTRATPEANAVLLSVLEERMLVTMHPSSGRLYVPAHPEFRVILTSNPDDYLGVAEAPDALTDRVVTFRLDTIEETTETGIVACVSGLPEADAGRIVGLVRKLRAEPARSVRPSLRTALFIARLARAAGARIDFADARFVQVCADVLRDRTDPARLRELLAGGGRRAGTRGEGAP